MPLISQQDILSTVAMGGGADEAIAQLKKLLEVYPPVRIIAIDVKGVANPLGRGDLGTRVTAVVETI